MEIQYEKAAVKYLKGLQKPQRDLILDAIEKLTHKPAEGDIKKMSGYTVVTGCASESTESFISI